MKLEARILQFPMPIQSNTALDYWSISIQGAVKQENENPTFRTEFDRTPTYTGTKRNWCVGAGVCEIQVKMKLCTDEMSNQTLLDRRW